MDDMATKQHEQESENLTENIRDKELVTENDEMKPKVEKLEPQNIECLKKLAEEEAKMQEASCQTCSIF